MFHPEDYPPEPMTDEDRDFLRGHARDYARPELDADRAEAYATWYVARYASQPDTVMTELPAHTYAWPLFLAQYQPPADPEDEAAVQHGPRTPAEARALAARWDEPSPVQATGTTYAFTVTVTTDRPQSADDALGSLRATLRPAYGRLATVTPAGDEPRTPAGDLRKIQAAEDAQLAEGPG